MCALVRVCEREGLACKITFFFCKGKGKTITMQLDDEISCIITFNKFNRSDDKNRFFHRDTHKTVDNHVIEMSVHADRKRPSRKYH